MDHEVDLLWPLVAVTRVMSMLVIGYLLLVSLATVFGTGSVLGIGEASVCVTSSQVIVEHNGTTEDDAAQNARVGVRPGVDRGFDNTVLCQDHPSTWGRVLYSLSMAPELVLLLGFFGGVGLLVRRARRHGLFSRSVAGAVSLLGWWVLIGELVVATAQALANSALVGLMLRGHGWSDFTPYWDVSVTGLLAGVGLLTIARVMRTAVDMRTELDATI